MSRTSQHLRKPAMFAVLVAMVGLVVTSAAAAPAAVSAAKPFELVLTGEYEYGIPDFGLLTTGAFTSKAPFCESGSAVDVWSEDAPIGLRFTCADGSGSITLRIGRPDGGSGDSDWRILEGTGQYAGLRGRGTVRVEDWTEPRSTFEGVVAEDAVAPTIALASAKASKVKGTKGVYTIPVAFDIRDNVEDNPVIYKVIVTRESGVLGVGAGPWLASKLGEAIGGIFFELRVRRPLAYDVRAVLIRTTAVDPVGNESSLDARVKLPK